LLEHLPPDEEDRKKLDDYDALKEGYVTKYNHI
jgi:hypothetical protein